MKRSIRTMMSLKIWREDKQRTMKRSIQCRVEEGARRSVLKTRSPTRECLWSSSSLEWWSLRSISSLFSALSHHFCIPAMFSAKNLIWHQICRLSSGSVQTFSESSLLILSGRCSWLLASIWQSRRLIRFSRWDRSCSRITCRTCYMLRVAITIFSVIRWWSQCARSLEKIATSGITREFLAKSSFLDLPPRGFIRSLFVMKRVWGRSSRCTLNPTRRSQRSRLFWTRRRSRSYFTFRGSSSQRIWKILSRPSKIQSKAKSAHLWRQGSQSSLSSSFFSSCSLSSSGFHSLTAFQLRCTKRRESFFLSPLSCSLGWKTWRSFWVQTRTRKTHPAPYQGSEEVLLEARARAELEVQGRNLLQLMIEMN